MDTNLSTKAIDNNENLQQKVDELGPWFHNLHLPDGTQTAPDHFLGDFPSYKWEKLSQHIPEKLSGWRALDIGCNAGYYSFELAKRGADVLGIDVDPHYLRQAQWAAEQFGLQSSVEFREMQVYDLARVDEEFDLILFMGTFYHLRYPLLALDIVSQKVKRLMVFQTLSMAGEEIFEDTGNFCIDDRECMHHRGWPKMAFIEHRYNGDPTNWWIPNRAANEAMLRSAGMKVMSRSDSECYICQPDPENPSCISTWNRGEYLSATGLAQYKAKSHGVINNKSGNGRHKK